MNLDLAERNLLSLSYGRIVPKDIDSNEGLLPASFERYTKVKPGDLVLRLTDLQNDQRSLRTGLVTKPGIITSAYLTLRASPGLDPRFFAYAMYAIDVNKTFYALGGGLRQSMGVEEVSSLRLEVPPLEEQRRIADFLYDQVACIDAVLFAREEQRRRIAVVTQEAVDEAFNPRGERHLVRAARMLSVLPGFAFGSDSYSDDERDCRLLRGINVGVGSCRWDEVAYWPANQVSQVSRFLLSPGDLVLGMDRPWIGDGLRIARVTEADTPCLLLQRVAKLEPFENCDPEYVMWAYRASQFRESVEADLTGLSVPHLSGDQILNHRLPDLPHAEQQRIGRELAAMSEWANMLIRRIDAFITLLNEYKRSLITAAVSGELDVSTARRGVPV